MQAQWCPEARVHAAPAAPRQLLATMPAAGTPACHGQGCTRQLARSMGSMAMRAKGCWGVWGRGGAESCSIAWVSLLLSPTVGVPCTATRKEGGAHMLLELAPWLQVRILKFLLSVDSPSDRAKLLGQAFEAGPALATRDTDYLNTTPQVASFVGGGLYPRAPAGLNSMGPEALLLRPTIPCEMDGLAGLPACSSDERCPTLAGAAKHHRQRADPVRRRTRRVWPGRRDGRRGSWPDEPAGHRPPAGHAAAHPEAVHLSDLPLQTAAAAPQNATAELLSHARCWLGGWTCGTTAGVPTI